MSCDRQILRAIAETTKQKVRFFDLVTIVWGPDKKKCMVAVGQKSLVLLRQDMVNKVNPSSDFDYRAIVKIVEDKGSEENVLLVLDMNMNSKWKSDRILVTSESRDVLMQHVRSCWQTHMMACLSKPVPFPLFKAELTTPPFAADVFPFVGYEWNKYRGYKFMRPVEMQETPNMIQTRDTGQYLEPKTGLSLRVQVHDLTTIEQQRLARREHIRWVAVEYKAKLVQDETQFYVIRNGMRPKRMNLVSDTAATSSWEIIIRTRSQTIICQLLRRQFIPPLCDVSQDISMIFRCPAEHWAKFEMQTILQAQLMADSVSPTCVPAVYRNLVQYKLNGLRFDEDGIEWVLNYQRLSSLWRKQAAQWLYSIVSIFVDAGILEEDLLTSTRFLTMHGLADDWEHATRTTNLQQIVADIQKYAETFVAEGDIVEVRSKKERVVNRWIDRIARYFAWATDGGFLGTHFNLEVMIEKIPMLEGEDDEQTATYALNFMLHMRDVDMRMPWEPDSIHHKLKHGHSSSMFNDRVMQWIINGEFLRKAFGRHNEAQYYKALAEVLKTSAGTTLKAYICRIFMEMRIGAAGRLDDDANTVVVPSLLYLLESGGVYLATFASAALVNLSHENEIVKMQLMSHGLAQAAYQNIKSKDDDLICYTTTLMVNLTKEAHHRYIMANAKLLPMLYDLLTSSYSQVKPAQGISTNLTGASLHSPVKEKILANICSLFGHFCKDEEYRDHLVDKFPHSIKCLCYIATTAMGGTPLMSKVLYALKQLCAQRNEAKMQIGHAVIKPLMQAQLKNKEVLMKCKPDFLSHALLLLMMLSSYKENCIKMDDIEGTEILMSLEQNCKDKLNDQLKECIRQLIDRIREVINKELNDIQ